MNASTTDFLQELVSEFPSLKGRLDRCWQHWKPESPPIIIAFSEIGNAIAEQFYVVSEDERHRIFLRIEQGMTGPDEELGTAVATGLIEALVARGDERPGLWTDMERLLGVASKKHALAWRRFGGT